MATAFDLTSYPLSSDTKVTLAPAVARDTLDDGSPRVRVLGDSFGMIELFFAPMDSATAQTFEAYINSNVTTEFEIQIRGITYQGYLWSDMSVDQSKGPNVVSYQVDFRGRAL